MLVSMSMRLAALGGGQSDVSALARIGFRSLLSSRLLTYWIKFASSTLPAPRCYPFQLTQLHGRSLQQHYTTCGYGASASLAFVLCDFCMYASHTFLVHTDCTIATHDFVCFLQFDAFYGPFQPNGWIRAANV